MLLEFLRRDFPEAEQCAYRRIFTGNQEHFDTRNNRLRSDIPEGLAFATLLLIGTYLTEANMTMEAYQCEINFLRKHGLEVVNNRFGSK